MPNIPKWPQWPSTYLQMKYDPAPSPWERVHDAFNSAMVKGDTDRFYHRLHIERDHGRGHERGHEREFTGVKGCEGYVAMDPYVEKYGW